MEELAMRCSIYILSIYILIDTFLLSEHNSIIWTRE